MCTLYCMCTVYLERYLETYCTIEVFSVYCKYTVHIKEVGLVLGFLCVNVNER